jgi:mono/diheme cytochrome c family protein
MNRPICTRASRALAALLLAGIGFARGSCMARRVPARRAEADGEQDKMLALGKKIFVERCAKCHDERGDKALKSGLPLNERDLSDEEITRAVSGRLKSSPEAEKRAVALYVISFMKRK